MIDQTLRRWYAPRLEFAAGFLHRHSVSAAVVTLIGLILGLGAAVAAGFSWWWLALLLWIASRLADGLDGAVARLGTPNAVGGYWDIVADFTVYGAFVVGVAVARPEARLAAVVLLCAYYVSGVAFLAWSALVEKARAEQASGLELGDERSLRFVGGLAEGFETVVAYAIVCIFPDRAEVIFWVFAAMVAVTAVQRVWFASSHLSTRSPSRRPG